MGTSVKAASAGAASSGIGFGGLLTILFIGLKLTGYITWSWIWVLSPLWIPLAFVIGLIAVIGLICLLISLVAGTWAYLSER